MIDFSIFKAQANILTLIKSNFGADSQKAKLAKKLRLSGEDELSRQPSVKIGDQ